MWYPSNDLCSADHKIRVVAQIQPQFQMKAQKRAQFGQAYGDEARPKQSVHCQTKERLVENHFVLIVEISGCVEHNFVYVAFSYWIQQKKKKKIWSIWR